MDVRIIGDTIVADGEVVALLNREPRDPTLQDRFERAVDGSVRAVELLAAVKDDLLKHKQAGWVRVSIIEEVLCNWSEKYE
jgi:hypothetical protein